MHWQTFNSFFGILADFVLFANTAVIIDTLCYARNVLSYKDRLTKKLAIFFIVAGISVGLYVNNLGWIGYLPICASVGYTICIYMARNEQQMRYASVYSMLLWLIHGIYIRAYTGSIVTVFLIVWTIIQIVVHQRNCRSSFLNRQYIKAISAKKSIKRLSVAQAQKIIDDLKCYEISLGRDPKTWYTYKNHVYGVAQIAKMLAAKIPSMDPNRLYVMGLLHDICRIEEDRIKRFHGILGYEKMIHIDKDVARECLLHTFAWNKLPPYQKCSKLFFYQKKDYEFVARFIKNNPPKEEDYLIQLCDNLANKDGFVTIEQRAKELLERKGWSYIVQYDFEKTNEIKVYFEKKTKCKIYDLLKLPK